MRVKKNFSNSANVGNNGKNGKSIKNGKNGKNGKGGVKDKFRDSNIRLLRSMLKNHNISLIGMPGSGKTTVGKALSKRYGLKFYDMDHVISREVGMTINDIFEKHGEEAFRNLESDCVHRLAKRKGAIISTGGGTVLRESNMFILRKKSIIIFIDRKPRDIIRHVNHKNRPLLRNNPSAVLDIYRKRIDLYRKNADITIKNKMNLSKMLREIDKELIKVITFLG